MTYLSFSPLGNRPHGLDRCKQGNKLLCPYGFAIILNLYLTTLFAKDGSVCQSKLLLTLSWDWIYVDNNEVTSLRNSQLILLEKTRNQSII